MLRLAARVSCVVVLGCGAKTGDEERSTSDDGAAESEPGSRPLAGQDERVAPAMGGDSPDVVFSAPLAESCESTKMIFTAETCDARAVCSDDGATFSCDANSDDSWSCGCLSDDGYGGFRIDGATGDPPCVLGLSLCSGEAAQVTHWDQCSATFSEGNAEYCQLEKQCRAQVELGAGVTAMAQASQQASCTADGASLNCSCATDTRSGTYLVSNVDAAKGCDAVLHLCNANGLTPDTSTCTLQASENDVARCRIDVTCRDSFALAGDARATQYRDEYAQCSLNDSDLWECTCDSALGSFSPRLSKAEFAGCEAVLDLCRAETTPKPSEPASCDLVAGTAGEGLCSFDLLCTQRADLGAQSVLLGGAMHVGCKRGKDTWDCGCDSHAQLRLLEVEAGVAWSACEQAAAACTELITDVVSPYHRRCVDCFGED